MKNFFILIIIFNFFIPPCIWAKESFIQKNKYKRSKLTNDASETLADRRSLLLSTGEDKVVDLDFEVNGGANGISYGDIQTVATTLVKIGDKRQLVFKPLKAGKTTVTIRDEDGTIRLIFNVTVSASNLLRITSEIRSLLRDIEGLNIRIVGSKVILEGEVLVPNDYGKLITVILDKAYESFVLNLTTLSPMAMTYLAKKIEMDINSFAPNVKVRVVNGLLFLEGSTENIDQAKKAADIANLYIPDIRPSSLLDKDTSALRLPPRRIVNNFIVVNPAPPKKQEKLVRITMHFVALAKDYNRVFGFKWMPGFTAAPQISIGQGSSGGATSSGPSFSATLSSLIPTLQSAQQAGFARILNTATVIVRSGQPATVNDQTEYPFAQQGANGMMTSSTKAVGLSVAVTPLILGQSDDIQMDLEINQTNLVGRAPTTGSAPVTEVNKIVTKVYIKSNESAAVAGVTTSNVGTDFNKDDPSNASFSQGTQPLFTLLRSKAYRKKKGQFVIFVTPQIIDNASEGTEDLKKNFRIGVK